MILYASQTHGRRNLKALQANGFHVLVTPDTYRGDRPRWVDGSPAPYAIDNGAWGCYRRGDPFNWSAFEKLTEELGDGAAWVIAPDIVCGGLKSLDRSLAWAASWSRCPVLIAVQDGMTPDDLRDHLSDRVGLAVGGSTPFKEKTTPMWGRLAAAQGCYLHVLRVNTKRRLSLCRGAGAQSVDGTSASIFSVNAPKLAGWADALQKQQTLGVW